MKKAVYFLAVAFLVSLVCNYRQCSRNDVRGDTITLIKTDTQYYYKTDTNPVVKNDTVLSYIYIATPAQNVSSDSVQFADSLCLEVVQRTYTDDSTYTAYVSGIRYDDYPRLDSIAVISRTVNSLVERTIVEKKKPPLTIGLNIGAGVGLITRKPDIYIGLGVSYNF